MTWAARQIGWELRVGGVVTRIAGEPPIQTEALLGWQTNVLEVTPFDQPTIVPGTPVTLRYQDYTAGSQWTQFAGEIDEVGAQDEPHEVTLRCVGPMIRLNRVRKGSRLDLSGMTDGEAIRTILDECGVAYSSADIADAGYTLGARKKVWWPRGTSGADMIAAIDEVFGTATRELPNGLVGRWFYDLVPRAADIRATYTIGTTATAFSLGRVRGGASNIQSSWEVRGAAFERSSRRDCTFQPYARAQEPNSRIGGSTGTSSFESDIIQDDALAKAICRRLMRWYNRQPDTIGLEVENDPNIMPGAVIGVVDAAWGIDLPTVKPYTVLTVDRAGETMQLGCVGGEAGAVGTIDVGYEKVCNDTSTESGELPNDFSADEGYTDPNYPVPENDPEPATPPAPTPGTATDPGTVTEDDLLSDVPATSAAGDCGTETVMGPGQWWRESDISSGDGWVCATGGDCGEVWLESAASTMWVNLAADKTAAMDAKLTSSLKTTVTGEFWFSSAAAGKPTLTISVPERGGDETRLAQVQIRSGGDATNPTYGAYLTTEFSDHPAAAGFALHPGCVSGNVANNGTWNFYDRVPAKGAWHTFAITFWEDTENAFVPRTTLTIDGYTEYVDDTRCTATTDECATEHADGHKLRIVGNDAGSRTAPFTGDPAIKLKNVRVTRLIADPSAAIAFIDAATCTPNPNYTPSPGVAGCAPDEPLCDCATTALSVPFLRDTTAGTGWAVDGTEYQATTAASTAVVNTNGTPTSSNDLNVVEPVLTRITGEFKFGAAAAGANATFKVSAEPWTASARRGASATVYAEDHTTVTGRGVSALLRTETNEPQVVVLGEKHPACPWSGTAQTTGEWNFEDQPVTIDAWHTFEVAIDESTTPQRLWLTVDSYTEYVEDVWYEAGTCNAAAGHPGALCDTVHTDGHRIQFGFTAGSGAFGSATADGTLASTGRITPQSGGNTSGTTEEKTFNGPYDMDLLSDGRLVVTDVLNRSFKIFDPANSWYRDAAPTWTSGTATYPFGVAVISDVIYVVLQNGQVRVYDDTGTYQSTIAVLTSGRRAAAGPDGYLYIAQADTLNRVAVMDTGGTVIRYLGSSGTGNGQFGTAGPGGIAFDADDNCYVADTTGKRINVYDASGTYVTHWGTAGSGAGQFDTPTGLTVRGQSVFVVNRNSTTAALSKLQVYDLDGTYLQEWVGTTTGTLNTNPASTDKFGYPSSVLTTGDTVLVTDGYGGIGTTGRNEVRVFSSAAATYGSPLGYLRNVAIGQAPTVACTRNPDYVPGATGGASSWQ